MLKMSTLFLRTLRDDPADAEVASHKLLVRAGAAPGPTYPPRMSATPQLATGCHRPQELAERGWWGS